MKYSHISLGQRSRIQVLSDAHRLIMFRQRELARRLTGRERSAIIAREFDAEADARARHTHPQPPHAGHDGAVRHPAASIGAVIAALNP